MTPRRRRDLSRPDRRAKKEKNRLRQARKVKAYRGAGKSGFHNPSFVQGKRGPDPFPSREPKPMKNEYKWDSKKMIVVKV